MLVFKPGKVLDLSIMVLNHTALETGLHNKSARINMVLEPSSPVKKDTHYQIFVNSHRYKGEMKVKICSSRIWYVVW